MAVWDHAIWPTRKQVNEFAEVKLGLGRCWEGWGRWSVHGHISRASLGKEDNDARDAVIT